jgi:rhodanese-related sulfurtransferase
LNNAKGPEPVLLLKEVYQQFTSVPDRHLQQLEIDGAMTIPLPELRQRISKLDHSKRYILCCNSARRSSVAAMIMSNEGYDAVYLKGGMQRWPYVIDEMAVGVE